MIEQSIFHLPETQYAFPTGTTNITIRIRVDKRDMPIINIIYGGKYDFATTQNREKMVLSYTDRLFNYFTVDLILVDRRLVYIFEINEEDKISYYSEDGLTNKYNYEFNYYNTFQVAYINKVDVHETVDWLKSACFYQIFIDRFSIGNFNKDMDYINLKWGEKPTPYSYAGGDFRGITNNLKYLKELGISAIYLTPIFKGSTNHKYDTEDYYSIDYMFGGEQDFKELVDTAHKLGIKIVLDAVFNHCSDKHEFFADVEKNAKESKYYDYFICKDHHSNNNINYECFAYCEYMPKFNTSNSDVQTYLINVAKYYVKKYDIDGWRLDVSDEVSHDFWRKFRTEIKLVKGECAIIGENWHNANSYLRGEQYDSIMNYAVTKATLDYFAFSRYDAIEYAEKLNEILMRNTDTVNKMMINLLDSHDTHRFLTRVKGDITKLQSALAILYMFVGVPCIYYGTESEMLGGYDPDSRRCFDINNFSNSTKTMQLIKKLTNIKQNYVAMHGHKTKIYCKFDLFIIERYSDKHIVKLTLNCSQNDIELNNNLCTNAVDKLKFNEFMIELIDES